MYNLDMNIRDLTQRMDAFVESKGWYAPNSPKPQNARSLAVSLAIETAEVLELVQWKDQPSDPGELADELADVALYLLQLAHISKIDLEAAILKKLAANQDRHWEDTNKPK